MKFVEMGKNSAIPAARMLTTEEKATLVSCYKEQMDLAEVEKEYDELVKNGGTPAELLLRELEDVLRDGSRGPHEQTG